MAAVHRAPAVPGRHYGEAESYSLGDCVRVDELRGEGGEAVRCVFIGLEETNGTDGWAGLHDRQKIPWVAR